MRAQGKGTGKEERKEERKSETKERKRERLINQSGVRMQKVRNIKRNSEK